MIEANDGAVLPNIIGDMFRVVVANANVEVEFRLLQNIRREGMGDKVQVGAIEGGLAAFPKGSNKRTSFVR